MGKTREGLLIGFIIIMCALAGETLNVAVSKISYFSFLATSVNIGTPKPLNLNLNIIDITLGFNLKLNFFSLVGIIMGVLISRRIR